MLGTALALAVALSVALVLLDGVARCVESAHALPALLLLFPVLLSRPLARVARWLVAPACARASFVVCGVPGTRRGRTLVLARGGRLLGASLAVRPPPAASLAG
jgi:hypothetical protein